jgi:hypothetical protein
MSRLNSELDLKNLSMNQLNNKWSQLCKNKYIFIYENKKLIFFFFFFSYRRKNKNLTR